MYAAVLNEYESNVRYYCRRFDRVFKSATGATIRDEAGATYIDFLSGAGSLNYGHNNPVLKAALIEYIENDGITNSLDLHTVAKAEFIDDFSKFQRARIDCPYKFMFSGPTGTNAVEAAIKLARKVTGRTQIGAFTNAFHGVSLGSLSVSASGAKRTVAGLPFTGVDRYPFDGYYGQDIDTMALIRQQLSDVNSGYALPAAFILETVQVEGGLNVASREWLRGIEDVCRQYKIILIVDDIQTGCGRTGPFFSSELSGIVPDIICLSKSLSGMGLPFSLLMIHEDIDQWSPGDHNGTFRGNNLAFVTARRALSFWDDNEFIDNRATITRDFSDALLAMTTKYDLQLPLGCGLLRGIKFGEVGVADAVCNHAFGDGLIMETCGIGDVVKLMPPLNASPSNVSAGLDIVDRSIRKALNS